jgi:hypothetical protein
MSEAVSEAEMSIPDSAWVLWKHSQNVDTAGMCDCGHEGLGPSWHVRNCAGANFALTTKVQKLVHELYTQWTWNHAEHCGVTGCAFDIEECHWPLPQDLRV